MKFEKGFIYHIYNQGNNRRKIFLNHDNYVFFLKKIKTYIHPYADIFAWCLMPNHFHLMVLVNEVEIVISNNPGSKKRSFNNSIAIMLRSYTHAYNNQHNFSGTLFRSKTKAECVNCSEGITPAFLTINGITQINNKNPKQQYPQVCFDYIHQNPMKAGLVKQEADWEYSSARDYAGMRDGKLVNKKLAKEYVEVTSVIR